MTDIEFDSLLERALIRAAEIDYCESIPSDAELDILVTPSKRFERKMARMLKNPAAYVRNLRRPIYLKILRTAALIILVLSLALGTSMLNPAVRAAFSELMRSWFPTNTQYKLVEDTDAAKPSGVTFGYIPDGFTIVEESLDIFGLTVVFESLSGQRLHFETDNGYGNLHISNEYRTFYETTINGYDVDVYDSSDCKRASMIVCHREGDGIIISLEGLVSADELLKMFEQAELEYGEMIYTDDIGLHLKNQHSQDNLP